MSTESTSDNSKSIHSIEKLNNDGCNYSSWAMCCCIILIGLDLWDVVNLAVTSTQPTPLNTPAPGSAQTTTLAPAWF